MTHTCVYSAAVYVRTKTLDQMTFDLLCDLAAIQVPNLMHVCPDIDYVLYETFVDCMRSCRKTIRQLPHTLHTLMKWQVMRYYRLYCCLLNLDVFDPSPQCMLSL